MADELSRTHNIHHVIVPYVYREYPRCLYRADGSACVVNDDAEKRAALADGWYLTIALAEAGPVPPTLRVSVVPPDEATTEGNDGASDEVEEVVTRPKGRRK